MLRDIVDGDPQVLAVIEVIRFARAEILVLADMDYDLTGAALAALADRIGDYPHRYASRPNRGLQTGRDLDGDGRTGGPGDAEGYGNFVGQGGLAILSRLPLDVDKVRDFSAFPWLELPGHIAPADGNNPERLSTTAHWDVPVVLPDGRRLHLFAWHATAPVFDGPEDRNGRRNHDEAAFWMAYLRGDLPSQPPDLFVLTGVANADPNDGDSRPQALRQLLAAGQEPRPRSAGARAASASQGGVNASQSGPAELDTVDWDDAAGRSGNLRVDYVLPGPGLQVLGSGTVWPTPDDPFAETVARASRHRLVWVDVALPEPGSIGDGFSTR